MSDQATLVLCSVATDRHNGQISPMGGYTDVPLLLALVALLAYSATAATSGFVTVGMPSVGLG